MEKKKNGFLPFLVLILVILISIYAVDVFSGKYIIIGLTEGEYQELVDTNTENADSLTDVSYSSLIAFLETDKTDESEYSTSFLCIDFSLTLLHNASLQNISSGIALLDYHTLCGHCITCFNTTDMGVIFIEPQSDVDITDEIIILNSYLDETIYGINTVWN